MERFRKWIKSEIDVEFFSCVHSMSTIFMYGFGLFLCGNWNVSYLIIIETMIMGYVIAWSQKLLFLKEKIYSRGEFAVRSILWNVIPIALTLLTALLFHWFDGVPMWIVVSFYIVMLFYYVMVWGALQYFYQGETNALNQMLTDFKKHQEGEE